jgi:methyl-accepting chemotaxis protein
VTQQTAANAEESSSASEELTAQAEDLKGLVSTYQINGSRSARGWGNKRRERNPAPAASHSTTTEQGPGSNGGFGHPIPFDDEEIPAVLGEF